MLLKCCLVKAVRDDISAKTEISSLFIYEVAYFSVCDLYNKLDFETLQKKGEQKFSALLQYFEKKKILKYRFV